MYRNIVILLIALVSVFLVVHSDNSLRCYRCLSVDDPNCGHEMPKPPHIKPVECGPSPGLQACGKLEYRSPLIGHSITFRDCIYAKPPYNLGNPCEKIMKSFAGGLVDSCTICHTDGCNGAIAASPRITHVILAAFGSLVFAFIFYGNV